MASNKSVSVVGGILEWNGRESLNSGLNGNVLPLFKDLRKEMEEKAAGHSGGYYIGHRF